MISEVASYPGGRNVVVRECTGLVTLLVRCALRGEAPLVGGALIWEAPTSLEP